MHQLATLTGFKKNNPNQVNKNMTIDSDIPAKKINETIKEKRAANRQKHQK